jgi:hypothetical protein
MGRIIKLGPGNTIPSDGGGEPIPEGKYDAEISNVTGMDGSLKVKSGPNAGEEMWRVQFKITSGDQTGRPASRHIMLFEGKEGKALIGYAQLAKAVGQPIDSKATEFELLDEKDVVGKPVQIIIKHGTYHDPATNEDRITYNVDRILPPANGGTVPAIKGSGKRVAL